MSEHLERAVTALKTYFQDRSRPPEDWGRQATYSAARRQRREAARLAVNAAISEGCATARQIALVANLPGRLVIRFIDDPQTRADAYAVEINHRYA